MLSNEDFEKDTIDAGEIGAGQTITAFYELILTEDPKDEFCSLQFRYKKPGETNSILLEHEAIGNYVAFEHSTENMRFGAAIVGFGLLMKESEYKGDLDFTKIAQWGNNALGSDVYGYRSEFLDLIDDASAFE